MNSISMEEEKNREETIPETNSELDSAPVSDFPLGLHPEMVSIEALEKTRKVTRIPVLLSIRGEQQRVGEPLEATELLTEGEMVFTPEGVILSYEESELTGMEGTTTTFTLCGSQVILTRTGTVNSQMVFEEGRQHMSLYEVPYGEVSIAIQTRSLRHKLNEYGGTIEIHYSIAIEHTIAGRNRFFVRVRRRTPDAQHIKGKVSFS